MAKRGKQEKKMESWADMIPPNATKGQIHNIIVAARREVLVKLEEKMLAIINEQEKRALREIRVGLMTARMTMMQADDMKFLAKTGED